jgi:hypothetical protein
MPPGRCIRQGFNVLTFKNVVTGTVAATSSVVASLVMAVFAITPSLSCALFVLWLACGASAMAQAPGSARPVFTRQSITAALSHLTATTATPQDPRDDWSRLRQLTKIEIVLFAQGLAGRHCRIVAVEDAALTVVDLNSQNRTTLRIPRTDVSEIKQWTGRRGSALGAVIGAAGGFALGFLSAVALADKPCGGSCADERILVGAALVGMPVAGGLLGYRLPGGNRTLTTIYIRPPECCDQRLHPTTAALR